MHAHSHSHTNTRTHPHPYTCARTARTHAQHTHIHTTHTLTHKHTHAHTPIHMHARTHTHTHARTHAHTHTHTKWCRQLAGFSPCGGWYVTRCTYHACISAGDRRSRPSGHLLQNAMLNTQQTGPKELPLVKDETSEVTLESTSNSPAA